MKKSTSNPKGMLKERVAKSNLIKIPLFQQNAVNKENQNPKAITNILKKKFKIHDRKLENEDVHNPFDLPIHLYIFEHKRNVKEIKSEPYIMSDPHTICDIDNTFYKAVEGRPLRQFTDVKVYMSNIRDITLFKANAAYLKDQIVQIENSFNDEVKEYNKIETLFVKSKVNFAHFAEDSYNKAKASQAKAEEKSLELLKMIERMEAYSFEYVKLRNQLSSLAATFETLTMYRKFLNSMSPNEWRKQYDSFIDCSSLFPMTVETEDLTSSSDLSLNTYKSSIAKLKRVEPWLYFKKSVELITIYNNLRKQCLNYMEIEVFSNNILNSVLIGKDYMKINIMTEVDELESFIDIYKAQVKWMEDREVGCKVFFEKLVKDKIKNLYASYDATKLFTCVQYVNTRLFGSPEDPKDNISILIVHIESLYIELTSALDCLNQDIVKEATRELFTEDIKMMKRAHIAQRTIKECDILSKALYTSFEPPWTKRK